MPSPRRRIWANHDFLKLWAGETVSLFGSEVTLLALPLAAVLTLGATPAQLGVLNAAKFAPFLLLSLPAGAPGMYRQTSAKKPPQTKSHRPPRSGLAPEKT